MKILYYLPLVNFNIYKNLPKRYYNTNEKNNTIGINIEENSNIRNLVYDIEQIPGFFHTTWASKAYDLIKQYNNKYTIIPNSAQRLFDIGDTERIDTLETQVLLEGIFSNIFNRCGIGFSTVLLEAGIPPCLAFRMLMNGEDYKKLKLGSNDYKIHTSLNPEVPKKVIMLIILIFNI